MNYHETPPSPRLAGYVKCFWSLEIHGPEAGEPEPVVPDGCIEIVFNLADRFRRFHDSGSVEVQPSSLIAGQMRQSILIGPSGDVRLFGVRFQPAGAYAFFRFDMSELADRIEPLDAVWASVREIEERLAIAHDFDSCVAIIEAELALRLRENSPIDRLLRRAVEKVSIENGGRPIAALAKDMGISERGLERRFKQSIGLSPKMFSRIVRFQGVLRSLESAAAPGILDAAADFGYYDQSHLINDFRQFAGVSPAAFFERSLPLTDIFLASE